MKEITKFNAKGTALLKVSVPFNTGAAHKKLRIENFDFKNQTPKSSNKLKLLVVFLLGTLRYHVVKVFLISLVYVLSDIEMIRD